MKKATTKRTISVILCLVTVFTLLPLGIVSNAAQEDFSAYVGNVNANVYANNYTAYAGSAGNTTGRRTIKNWAWKGDEALNRIDMLTRDTAYNNVTLTAGDFVSESSTISKDNVGFTFMRAVEVDTDKNKGKLLFDIITHESVQDIPAKTFTCAWVSVSVPADAAAGDYTGKLYITSGADTLAEFTYNLTVFDLTQPELDSTVDLWLWPYNTERYYSGKTTEEFWSQTSYGEVDDDILFYTKLDKKYEPAWRSELELYSKAGGDTITAYICEQGRTNGDANPSMIKWYQEEDGSLSFDFSDFDYWVELNMEYGIDKKIKCYTMGNFRNMITYFDKKKNVVNTWTTPTGDSVWKKYWDKFIPAFIAHLEEKGWFDITYMALDERDYTITKNVLDEVEKFTGKNGKSLKVATAVACFECETLLDRIEEVSFAWGLSGGHLQNIVNHRNELGLTTTLYTCGADGSSMVNTPDDSAMSIYVTYKEQTQGYLRWALQKYNYDPFDSGDQWNTDLPAGDMYLIYPSDDGTMRAQSTPRYEKICEGLRDIAKAKYLENELYDMNEAVRNAFLATSRVDSFRSVIKQYATIATTTERTPFAFEKESYELSRGEDTSVVLLPESAALSEIAINQIYLDDQNFTFSEQWHEEGRYFWLFLWSSDHYAVLNSAADQEGSSYSFDIYGDTIEIYGSKDGGYGQMKVIIDGEDAGTLDGYGPEGKYQQLFKSGRLPLADHHVEVVACGKNAKSSGYNLQVDYATATEHGDVVYSVSDDNIATIDSATGMLHGKKIGYVTVTATLGSLEASVSVHVRATKAEVEEKLDELLKLDTSALDSETMTAFEKIIAEVQSKLGSADPDELYGMLTEAQNMLICSLSIKTTPYARNFVVGEPLSVFGGLLCAEKADGSKEDVPMTLSMLDDTDTSTAGEKTVNVTYMGKQVSYTYKVNEQKHTEKIFTDVTKNKWFIDAVDYAVTNNLFNGISKDLFAPDSAMNRAMLVTVLYRVEGEPEVSGTSTAFSDVKSGQYYAAPVKWASENGIVNGTSPTTFSPTASITREQMAAILCRYTEYKGGDTSARADLSAFPDSTKVSKYARDAMSWANAEGIIAGTTSGSKTVLAPQGSATRAQVATILMRYLEARK